MDASASREDDGAMENTGVIKLLAALLVLAFINTTAMAQPSLSAPASARIGSEVSVTVTGNSNPRDFVSIVPKGSKAGFYAAYKYLGKPGVVQLRAPAIAGEYEIRLLGAAAPYPTLASRPLLLESVEARVEGPAQVSAGAKFELRWTGPGNALDYVGIGDADPKGRLYITYAYTRSGSPVSLVAPDKPGPYVLRYYLAEGNTVVASQPITVVGVDASVSAPAQVAAGKDVSIQWSGPNNPRDFITLLKAGSPEKRYEGYAYTTKGSPLSLRAPDQPGDYEVRYLTGQTYATLATTRITVTAIGASIQGPAEAVAGASFAVTWKGPDNRHDYLTVVAKDAREGESGNYAYAERGNPVSLRAPLAPGEYEIRYATGQSHLTLARAPIRILPAQQEPGLISVTSSDAGPASHAVEIILDASGSMLQRIGSQRRIDIAKQTLTKLTSATIPAGTPFALRVFGREVDSCQTDLEVPLGPLDAAAVGAKIGKLEAKNNARTPIGDSLGKVAADLQAAKGERLVIVLTDGEETCGGDPAAAIAALKSAGATVRVNIVGFAIDDARLAATFRHWSALGNGQYFDAKDGASLSAAMSQAMRPRFEVLDAEGKVVASGAAGGEPVGVMPGNYTVRALSHAGKAQPVVVKAKQTSSVTLSKAP
jgi:hypothetical protein